jgi:hypothetical protein
MPLVKFLSSNQRCPICSGRILDDRAFRFKLHHIYENEYTALEEYKGTRTAITIRHNICGHE